ncbi:MAG: hypothetical protein ABI451_09275, partial [Dokdonella sp.]
MKLGKRIVLAALSIALVYATSGQAREGEKPYSWTHPTKNTAAELARLTLPAVDRAARLQEDARAANPAAGAFEKRLRIGTDQNVQVQPRTDGTWETLADGRKLWRLVVSSKNATDLRFGFSSYHLPKGAMLTFVDNAGHSYDGPYDDTDATADGQFWTAPISGSEITLELVLPANTDLADGALVLSSVSTGYRNIMARDGAALLSPSASGTCNIDVVCSLGNNYRDEIRAVAKYTFSSAGSTFLCTGTLVMNTARDFRPFFLTANHCISTQAEASSITTIWNFQSPTCGQHGGGSQTQTQTGGATLRAHRADVDFTLVELSQMPPASYNVYYDGWDVSGTAPGGSIGIHHPSGDVKAITQGIGTLPTINSCIGTGGVMTHWRTGAPYSQGTTEGGSSGSAILVPFGDPSGHDKLITGTLSGGDAACSGNVPNSGDDCYGKLSVSFNGSSSASRLKDWLDPGNTGVTTLAGAQPGQTSTATTIIGSPLKVIVGRDHSFQILNSAIPGIGQVYPSTSSGPGDMGWFVRMGSTLYSPDFSSHGGTATGNLGTRTPYTPQSLTGVTGSGSSSNPYAVSVGGALGSSGLVATEQVTYINGSNFFTKRFTLKNNSSTSQVVKIFLGADIYLAGSDSGVPFRIASSGITGGQNCTTPANYSILFIPQTATDGYTGASYSNVWTQIGAGTLNNALSTGCLDNGAGLQWNRTIAAGASVTIQAATSFGDIPTTYALSVAKAGSGSGTVTSNPAGISCGSTCTANFFSGNSVTLTATPASGSTFTGWSGSCTGTGTCTVAMTAARSVTASFNSGVSAATLRFDSAAGATTKTILRSSGTPVKFAWTTSGLPSGTTCRIYLRPNNAYAAVASPIASGSLTSTTINNWATGTYLFYLGCSNGAASSNITLVILQPGPSAALRFDSAAGPTSKTIVRNSGTPVKFAWTTSTLPSGTTCRIYLRPNNTYGALASPTAGGTLTNTTMNNWATGTYLFYLGCSNGTASSNITLVVQTSTPAATLRFDSSSGPATKTVVRNSGTPVKFAWTTSALPSGTTCRIYLRPNNTYGALASPTAAGTLTSATMNNWATGTYLFYLSCSNGTASSNVTLVVQLGGLGGSWTDLGPAPAFNGQTEGITNRPVVGAVNAVAPHPTNAAILYVAAVNGGLWRSTNANTASPVWTRLLDTGVSLSMSALRFDPTDAGAQTLLAGTGRVSSLSGIGGALTGVMRTTNGGTTWTVLNGGGTLNNISMTAVAARGSRLMAATSLGLYRSTNTGTSFSLVSGAGGSGLPAGKNTDLVGDPINNSLLFTVVFDSAAPGIYRSTNTGANWTKVSDASTNALIDSGSRGLLAVGRTANVFLAVVGSDGKLAAVIRSSNGTSGWTNLGVPTTAEENGALIGIHPGGQGDNNLSLAADPTNSNIVYIGGDRQPSFSEAAPGSGIYFPNSLGAMDYSGRLFRGNASQPATSRWVTLTHSGTSNNSSPHADSRSMTFDASGNLIESDDGGVYKRSAPRSTTGSWASLNGNLEVTEYHGIAYDGLADRVIGGAQDTGTSEQQQIGSRVFNSVATGDGGDTGVDDNSSATVSSRYSSYYNLGAFRRRAYNAANVLQSQTFPELTPINGSPALVPQFYTPLAVNRVNGRRLLFGADNGVYESLDQGATVNRISTLKVNAFDGDPLEYGVPSDPDLIFLGSGDNVALRLGTATAGSGENVHLGLGAGTLNILSSTSATSVVDVAVDAAQPSRLFVLKSSTVFFSSNT